MLPRTIALVDDDQEYTEFLAQYLREQGGQVTVFHDSNDLLASRDGFGFDFYVVDLMLPGADGLNVVKVLRQRTSVGVLVVSGRLDADAFKEVINAGADMYLVKPVQFEQVALVSQALHRRIAATAKPDQDWQLDRRARQLVAPDGARADLSDTDVSILACFVDANGEAVSREVLHAVVDDSPEPGAAANLNATIYRLRRRIERATPTPFPLQSKSRVGYTFNARLISI